MLLKNDNQKFIKTLSSNCLQANKNRNRIAVLAIILTTILFMAVATVFQGSQVSMKEQSLEMAGSKYMVAVNFVTKVNADKIKEHKDFIEAGLSLQAGEAENRELSSMTAQLLWGDKNYAKNTYKQVTKGHYPKEYAEIACDTEVIRKLGIPKKIGTTFTLKYNVNGENREKEMTLCGIWDGKKYEQKSQLLISEKFAKEIVPEEAGYTVSGIFDEGDNLDAHAEQVLKDVGIDSENAAYGICQGYMNSNKPEGGIIVSAAAAILLVLLAGYLIIYNIFRISVIKDIRLYGQLKTIGASPRQIKYMVRKQGMKLLIVGMPIGLVLGWLLGNLLLKFVMQSTAYSEPHIITPHILVWFAAALFTFVTVWISCGRPGKMAGRISPVEALQYQETGLERRRNRRGKNQSTGLLPWHCPICCAARAKPYWWSSPFQLVLSC